MYVDVPRETVACMSREEETFHNFSTKKMATVCFSETLVFV